MATKSQCEFISKSQRDWVKQPAVNGLLKSFVAACDVVYKDFTGIDKMPVVFKRALIIRAIKIGSFRMRLGHNEKINHLQARVNGREGWSGSNDKRRGLVSVNDKIKVHNLDIVAGVTCPFASLCKAEVNVSARKVVRGPACEFLCYAAKLEAAFPASLLLHWYNLVVLRMHGDDFNLCSPEDIKDGDIIRLHSSGELYNARYFNSLVTYAKNNPRVTIYGYTKALPYVLKSKPVNFKLVYSFGGVLDGKYTELVNSGVHVPCARVVKSHKMAASFGLPVACEFEHVTDSAVQDYNYIMSGESFALLVH